jgi:hypothetical protein
MRILMLLWIDSKMSEPESYIKPEILLNSETPPSPVAYNKRDLILYALGVGATDLRYTYEGGTIILIFRTLILVCKIRNNMLRDTLRIL